MSSGPLVVAPPAVATPTAPAVGAFSVFPLSQPKPVVHVMSNMGNSCKDRTKSLLQKGASQSTVCALSCSHGIENDIFLSHAFTFFDISYHLAYFSNPLFVWSKLQTCPKDEMNYIFCYAFGVQKVQHKSIPTGCDLFGGKKLPGRSRDFSSASCTKPEPEPDPSPERSATWRAS